MVFLGWYFLGCILCLAIIFLGNHPYYRNTIEKTSLRFALVMSLTSFPGAIAWIGMLIWAGFPNSSLYLRLNEWFKREGNK